MAEHKSDVRVDEFVEKLKKDPSSRFSKGDFQMLVYAVLSDETFKAKKYLLHNSDIQEDVYSINDGMRRFLDKVLKHAGMSDATERAKVIDTFDYSPKDVEWIMDAVDEAMYIYSECGKNMRMFRGKMRQLAVRKMVRSGKFQGQVSYKKTITDLEKNLAKRTKN